MQIEGRQEPGELAPAFGGGAVEIAEAGLSDQVLAPLPRIEEAPLGDVAEGIVGGDRMRRAADVGAGAVDHIDDAVVGGAGVEERQPQHLLIEGKAPQVEVVAELAPHPPQPIFGAIAALAPLGGAAAIKAAAARECQHKC